MSVMTAAPRKPSVTPRYTGPLRITLAAGERERLGISLHAPVPYQVVVEKLQALDSGTLIGIEGFCSSGNQGLPIAWRRIWKRT